jgi:hypothetical protein
MHNFTEEQIKEAERKILSKLIKIFGNITEGNVVPVGITQFDHADTYYSLLLVKNCIRIGVDPIIPKNRYDMIPQRPQYGMPINVFYQGIPTA